jgi:hypothetical protein
MYRLFSKLLSVLFALFILHIGEAEAQIFKKRFPYTAPKTLLIKLPTYSKKIAAYQKGNNTRYANQCRKDAAGMQKAIVTDFKNNFTYCNYYFYYDTLQDAVSNKQFDGILYDKNMTLIASSPIATDDTCYQIAYFGKYLSAIAEETDMAYNTGSDIQRMNLISRNSTRLPDPLPNGTIHTGVKEIWKKVVTRQYTYSSKLFDIYYIKSAEVLSDEMKKYYGIQ